MARLTEPVASTSKLLPLKRCRSPQSPPAPALKRRETLDSKASASMTRGFFLAFIDAAFDKLAKGNAADYQALVNVFSPWLRQDAMAGVLPTGDGQLETPSSIRAWLDALTHSVPQIDPRAHSLLVETILSITWTALDEICIGPYITFVKALLGAKPEFVGLVVRRAVKGFQYNTGFRSRAAASSSAADVTRRLAYERIHRLLRTLLGSVPALPSVLWHQINASIPPKRESREAHVVFLRNALRVIEYCPMLVDDILRTVISAAIALDAEIQCEIADFADDAGKLDQEVFGAGIDPFDRPVGEGADSEDEREAALDFDDISSDEGGDEDELARPLRKQDEAIAPEVIARLKDLAAKLDAVLKTIFGFLERMQIDGLADEREPPPSPPEDVEVKPLNRLAVQRRQRVFDILIRIFDSTILSTFKTQHTQFLLFWAASFDAALCERFVYFLLSRSLYDAEVPTVTRVAAACYLASFVSRATYIDGPSAKRTMGYVLEYVNHALDDMALDATSGGTMVQQHAIFYAAVQTAFYIFCFRWRDFAEETSEGRKWMTELAVLQRAVMSVFNPLKICSAGVCAQFAHVARSTDFMYCFSVLEANRRQDEGETPRAEDVSTPTLLAPVPAVTPLIQQALHEARMDSHFPFDPYKLPLTAPYVDDLYRAWQNPADDEEDEEVTAIVAGTPENAVAIPKSLGAGVHQRQDSAFAKSFEAMSLSPESADKMASMSLAL